MANLINDFNKTITNNAKSVDNLLNNLFADKKTIYIDDINFKPCGGYDVSYCKQYTLQMGKPQWLDAVVGRPELLKLIADDHLNHWESFGYDAHTGSLQPISNVDNDLEAFLDENYQEVIKIYLEKQN